MNRGAGFLQAIHQGTVIETADGRPPVADLFAAEDHASLAAGEPAGREFLTLANARHLVKRSDLGELAAELPLPAPEMTDLSGESVAVEKLYQFEHPEIGPFDRQCPLVRWLTDVHGHVIGRIVT